MAERSPEEWGGGRCGCCRDLVMGGAGREECLGGLGKAGPCLRPRGAGGHGDNSSLLLLQVFTGRSSSLPWAALLATSL